MMKYLLVSLLMLLVTSLSAQYQDRQKEDHPLAANRLILKGDFANAVNPKDPSVLLSLEYQFRTWVSFTQEVGMVADVRNNESTEDEYLGFKVREELRFYYQPGNSEEALWYFSVNAMYRYLKVDERLTAGYGCTSSWTGSCDYLRFYDEETRSHRYGGGFRLGITKSVSPRLTLEGDIGMNMMYLLLDRRQEENVTYFFRDDFFFNNERGLRLQPTFSAKVGYVLMRRPQANNP
ncbi:hypothetical protein [Marinoscillum sp.]|uniref:hypothetical protein n=2 Tax=Marinoscillum sp. TaxID=2024838 RepID=UPI0032F82988